jgi:hypothetical protein
MFSKKSIIFVSVLFKTQKVVYNECVVKGETLFWQRNGSQNQEMIANHILSIKWLLLTLTLFLKVVMNPRTDTLTRNKL